MSRFCAKFDGTEIETIEALVIVRELSRGVNEPIDFVISKEHANLIPLISQQHYTDQIYVDTGNLYTSMGYETIFALELTTKKNDEAFMDQVAAGHRIRLFEPLPFIQTKDAQESHTGLTLVAYGFATLTPNADEFIRYLQARFRTQALFANVQDLPREHAAATIGESHFFIGDHGVNRSIAHAMNRPVIYYESKPEFRTKYHSCPYGYELTHADTNDLRVWAELFQAMVNRVHPVKVGAEG